MSAADCQPRPVATRRRRQAAAGPQSDELRRRAAALSDQLIEYIPHPSFKHPEIAETILNEELQLQVILPAPHDLPDYMARLYEVPLLTKEDEAQLFLRMNCAKYRADELRRQLNVRRPKQQLVEEIERLLADSVAVRNRIVRANLRLVVALAKKFADPHVGLEELISEAHLPLMRAVELFDFSRGNRFSTYATWAIRNHFVRTVSDGRKHRVRFSTSEAVVLDFTPENRPPMQESEQRLLRQRRLVERLVGRLDARDQQILAARFGLADHGHPQTLSEIGRELGISKERVRQLSIRALDRLRELALENQELAQAGELTE